MLYRNRCKMISRISMVFEFWDTHTQNLVQAIVFQVSCLLLAPVQVAESYYFLSIFPQIQTNNEEYESQFTEIINTQLKVSEKWPSY